MHRAQSPSIVIVGAGGHAVSVANVAFSSGMNVVAFVDDEKAGSCIWGIPIITNRRCFETSQAPNMAIAIGDNVVRERVKNEYKSELPSLIFPTIIHESAVIGVNAEVGEGTVVMPQVNVGPNTKVGCFCILNTSASIDHDCEMNSFASLAPRAVTGGNVKIGCRTAISIGATIKNEVTIGDDVVIGANSYVNAQVDSNVVAYGSPCKFIRKRAAGEAYLS